MLNQFPSKENMFSYYWDDNFSYKEYVIEIIQNKGNKTIQYIFFNPTRQFDWLKLWKIPRKIITSFCFEMLL